jgi:hypothetical protein
VSHCGKKEREREREREKKKERERGRPRPSEDSKRGLKALDSLRLERA